MDYGMIGNREKAKRYAEERKRFLFNKFDLTFHGDNNNHHVTFENGVYSCDCEFFITHKRCAHTMALEILPRLRAQLKATELLLIDDLFLRKLPTHAGDELADVLMTRYEKSATIITSYRPVDDWARLLGDVVVITPLLDRLMHHGHLLKFEGKSWRLKEAAERVAPNAELPSNVRGVTPPAGWGKLTRPQVEEFEVATGVPR